VLHGHDHREANIRRARIQLRRVFPYLSESQADDQVRDHYEGILERVAATRDDDGGWPPGAFPHDDDGLEELDGWIVNALIFELRNYQRNRASRHESLDGAQESGGEGAIDGWPSTTGVDPAMVAEERATLDAVLSGAEPDVLRYVELARLSGLKRSEIQRQTTWSDRRYKQVKAATERYLESARDAYRALPVFLARWVFHSSNNRVRGAAGAGAGVGAVKVGTVVVASLAVVGGALELHSKPAHHPARSAHHAQAQAAAVPPATAIAVSAPRPAAAQHVTSAAKAPVKRGTSSAGTGTAAIPHSLAYLGSPTSQSSSPPTASTSSSSGASTPVVHGSPPKSGGLSYLGGP
jgi:hypothetical protein